MHALSDPVGKLAPAVNDRVERPRRFRIVLDRVNVRAGQNEIRLELWLHFGQACEPPHHADRVLQWVPSRDLDDERSVRPRDGTEPDYVGATVDAAWRAVGPNERRQRLGGGASEQTRMSQDGARHLVCHFLVLGREGVDRGRDDHAPAVVADVGNILAARKDGGGGVTDVRLEKPPTDLGLRVRVVGADVASPDDDRAKPAQRGGQPGSLGVVQHDHIAGPDPSTDSASVCAEDVLVDRPLVVSKGRAVAV